jgi:hypothetical protein
MFISELKLFSIGIISVTLNILDVIIVNIVQIRGIIDILDSAIKPILIHNGRVNYFLIENLRLI